jgi:hypothetical protein
MSDKDIAYFILKRLDILIEYQIFTFSNLIQISVFSGICHLFIDRISIDLNIENSKICLPIMLGVSFSGGKKSLKGNIHF